VTRTKYHLLSHRGRFRWERRHSGILVASGIAYNGITATALNGLLDREFRAASQITSWFVGLITSTGFTKLDDANDTMASHAGWTELTAYSEANRVQWSPDAAANQFLCNGAAMEFTITTLSTVKGMFVTSSNTKGGTTGTLWATALLADPQTMPVGEILKLFYELEAKSG